MANTKIQSEQIQDGAITAAKIADGAIVAAEVADNAITTAKINADAVTGAKIADDAINSEHYTDGSIDTAHIADDQVTQAKMANDSVGADELASSAVVTASIVDANITTAKIADDAVTSAKLDTNIDIAGTLDVTGATTLDSTLGIGVASPEGVFEIEDGGTGKSILQKITLDNDDVYGLVVGNDSYSTTLADGLAVTVSNAGIVGLQARGTSSKLALRTVGAERVRIDDNGRVLLGAHNTNGTSFEHGGVTQITVDPSSWSSGLGIGTQSNVSEGDGCGIDFFQKISLSGAKWNTARIGSHAVSIGSSAYGDIRFSTMNATTLSEKMRVLPSGGITFNGDTATANALDDYEEGTFQPTPSISGGSGSIAFKSAADTLSYTKIGDLVHIQGYLQIDSNTVNGGRLNLGNLPFTSVDSTEASGYSLFTCQLSSGSGSQASGFFTSIGEGLTLLQVQTYTGVGTSNDSAVTMVANSFLFIQGQYKSA